MYVFNNPMFYLQGSDRPARRATGGAQKAAQRVPVARVLQARLPRAQDAVLLQT